jgi:hypothetical protein
MDENLKRLLVATGGRQLLYDDSEDLVLGTGPIDHKNHGYRGNNFIGNFMEELRGDFIKSGVLPAVGLEEEKDLHIDAIIANSDEKTWIMQKIDDILIILQYLRNYDNAKYGSNRMNIDTEDVDVVLDNLYSKCFSLFKRFHVENARIPKDFIAHVKKSFDGTGMYMNKPAIRKLWSYVLFIMESVRKLVDFNISDFGNEIVKFENLYRVSKEGVKCDGVFDLYGKLTEAEKNERTTKNCNNATRGSSGGASPTIVLTPPSVVGYTVYTGVFTYNGSSVFGVLPSSWAEPSYTASDPEDGDLTANVQIIFPDTYTPHAYNPKPSFLANIKSFFTNKKAEAIGGGGGCLAVTTRHYRVTDGSGHSTDAYRDFTSVC